MDNEARGIYGADTVQDHIHAMKRYYNQVPIKPEWLSYKDILRYEAKMTTLKSLDDLRDLLEAHDWKNSMMVELHGKLNNIRQQEKILFLYST